MATATIELAKKKTKSSIHRRGLPAELFNELFASLPFENAFGLLGKIPNGLLARNVQKMSNDIKEAIKNNRLNELDCGPRLAISEEGLLVKHFGPDEKYCGRTILPIPTLNLQINKPRIAFYFEVQIMNGRGSNIGFCDQLLPLKKWLGYAANSIGFFCTDAIFIDGWQTEFGNDGGYFNKGEFVGLGIIQQANSKLECFATLNGKFLGKAELPSKFAHFRLFPTVNLYSTADSIRVNFGNEEWKFKEFKSVLNN